jgi:TonB family protein
MDPELLYCPAPEAPRITELREGALTLELEIGPDGAVQASRVVAASGHPAWQASARTALASWRYVAGPALRVRRVPFDFRPSRP